MTIDIDTHIVIKDSTVCIDSRGLKCPDPLMIVRRAIRRSKSNPELSGKFVILSDDPRTPRDLINFADFSDYKFVSQHEQRDKQENEYTVTELIVGA